MDTRNGDDPGLLKDIASAVDWWFVELRKGFYPVATTSDLNELIAKKILGVPVPPSPRQGGDDNGQRD